MRRLAVGLVVLGTLAGAAVWLSPWPGVLVIRAIFDRGAAAASAKLERHVPPGVTTTTVAYDANEADAVLDILAPPGARPVAPVVVWVHGGGFVSGRRQDVANYLQVLAGKGFVVANVDYTIAPEATYPEPVQQVLHALAYLSREAATLGIDPARIVLAGDSAGAQIAAQTAAVLGNPDYAGQVGIEVPPGLAPVRGVILFCGVYDIGGMGRGGGVLGWFVQTTGWAYSGSRDWREDARFGTINFLPFLTPGFPPAFVSAGSADPLGPQSVLLAERLTTLGAAVETLFFPAGHSPPLGHEYQFDLDGEAGQLALERMVAWLRQRWRAALEGRAFVWVANAVAAPAKRASRAKIPA